MTKLRWVKRTDVTSIHSEDFYLDLLSEKKNVEKENLKTKLHVKL